VYLKSLTIRGFKSFADRSVINFEPGVSAIVGPNGSGKSNVSEAVLWVLGEQKVTSLRVQSMEELIFSGSSAREPVGVAEVELVLDNSDQTLPVEFDQVSVSRRMYRCGESEYFLNGAPCRRMDIIDILYDSGIGQGTHSIIGQGNLTAVLESRPEDRRALIEEAAGILKHKRRKEKASRKLDAMDASLARVDDLIRIIESQLKPLERQATRAQQYQKIADELKQLDLVLAVDELRGLKADWSILDRKEREVQAEAELVHFRLNEREAELAKRQRVLEERGLFVGDLNEQRIRCQSIIQRLDAGMLVLEEKGKHLISRLSDLRNAQHGSRSRLAAARSEHQDIAERLSAGQAVQRALTGEYNELIRSSEATLKSRKQAEEEHDRLLASQRSRLQALDTARLALAKATESLSALDMEEQLLAEQAKQFDHDFAGTQSVLAERRAHLEDFDNQLLAARASSKQTKAEVDKRVRLLDDRRRRLEAERDKLAAIQAEIHALEEVDRAFESASPALSWIQEHRERCTGVIGQISASLSVKERVELPFGMQAADLEALVERLLGADLHGLLVEDDSSARLIAEGLVKAEEQQGEITLLPLAGSRAAESPAGHGVALLSLLDCPDEQRQAMAALLGDVYLVETISEAQKERIRDKSGARFVSPEAAVVWPSGKLTVGIQLANTKSVLERRRRLNTLVVEEETATTTVADAEMELSKAEKLLEEVQNQDFEISKTAAKLEGDAAAIREEVGRIEESLTQLIFKREGNEKRLSDLASRRLAAEPMAAEYEQRIAGLQENIAVLDLQAAASAEALKRAQEERSTVMEQLADCKLRFETASGSANYLSSRHDDLEREIKELDEGLAVSAATELALDITAKRVDPLYQLYDQLHAGASIWAEKLRDQAQLEQSDSENLRCVINEASTALEQARDELAEINTRLTELRVEKARLETDVEHAVTRVTEGNETPLELALETPSPEDRSAAEDKAGRLRRKLSTMGAVNHVAADEYRALKARRDYMLSQIEDLSEARKALTRIERALDRKMRNRFLETFEQVNQNFQEIFGTLFPGGFGQLLLCEGETPEQNGVEVSAQPKGKKITKLSLMSGGEKALVALALLFAVYRIRKVPFYILDEVEAALDDTNLGRLMEYFGTLRHGTQLILVTHQRRTMESADVLYGVTMQAAGVSKLVSQRLDQALRYASEDSSGGGEDAAVADDGGATNQGGSGWGGDTPGYNSGWGDSDDARGGGDDGSSDGQATVSAGSVG